MYEINSDSFAIERAEAFAQGMAQGVAEGRIEGIAKGIALGRANREKDKAERHKRITTGLLNYGFDLDAISDLTGIDLSELESIVSKSLIVS
jgi:predicted transposase YdaD